MHNRLVVFLASGLLGAALAAHAQQTSSSQTAASSSTAWPSDTSSQSSPSGSSDTTGGIGAQSDPSAQSGPTVRDLSSTRQQTASPSEGATLTTAQQQQLQMQMYYPPAPPSEFQKFVAASTGQRLNIYGADLFRRIPNAFTPSNLVPADSNYVIGADDELRVRIWGAINYSGNLRVDRSGNIYLPQIGSVHVAGLKFSELDHHLRQATGRVYRNFDLSADLGRIRSMQIYVTGQARKPGMYTVSSLSSLVDALFASGGPAPEGSLRHILLKREGKTVVDFDLYAFLLHGDKSNDMRLLPEDVLYIAPAGPQVAIYGSIRKPAIYEMREGETVGDLIDAAGKTSAMSATSKVSLDRADQNQRRATEFPLDATGRAARLEDGDIVRLFSIVPAYKQSVILRGSVANAGHYGWHEGMHVSDLIPDRDALLSRDYWWKRSHLGLAAPEFEPAIAPADPLLDELTREKPRTPQSAQNNAGNNQQNNGTGSAQTQQNATSNAATGSTQQNSGIDRYRADQNSGNASIAMQTAAAEELDPETGLPKEKKNKVRLTPHEIDWDYAVIERTDPNTFKTSLIPFDLGKLVLNHDASQDLALEAGDTVTIFSQNDIRVPLEQQTKYVTIEGEVAHAGTYSVKPGETLRDVVLRAGGLTSKAYLYGIEFDRESTRILQQQRIDEYVRNIEQETMRSSIAFTSYASLSGQAVSQGATNPVIDQFIAQLHRIRATGRIVLNMKPSSHSIDDIPALSLENGDKLIVPAQPATINVVGAVYNQNSFLFADGHTVNGYLKMAGGPNRDADAKHAFVIRADGSVINSTTMKSYWGNGFMDAKLNPGDTLLVPEKNFKPNLSLKSTLEWTQMFSQLAMGVATVSLL